MKRLLVALALATACAFPTIADEEKSPGDQPAGKEQRPPITRTEVDPLPDGIARFNGMLVGRLVKKDVEKGTFVINVDAIPRVWRNSKAENPKSIVGKNIEVDGVSGKWLDVLLVVRPGETLECEAKHDGGPRLTFPGELLRKVAPYDPQDYPVLPEDFRGFHGAVAAKIIKKDPEMFELIIQVDKVLDTWKNNRAKDAKAIEGKQLMLAGFWQRKDEYHRLKVDDQIEVGLQHIGMRSDHMNVVEFVRRKSADSPESATRSTNESDGIPAGMQGFSGSLVGRLQEKDVERGTLTLTVDAVPRVWNNNKSRRPKDLVGKTVHVEGIANRLLDVLLTTKKGETLEIAARHNGGDRLTFPGELFRKVAPYKAEDYPVLPDDFRGFKGVITAEIIKKDEGTFGLIVKIDGVKRPFDGSRAENASSIDGKSAILAGFWRRKELYADLKVGDRIEAGVAHQVYGSDILSVVEGVRKTDRVSRDEEK